MMVRSPAHPLTAMKDGSRAETMLHLLRNVAVQGIRRLPAQLDRPVVQALRQSPSLRSHARLAGDDPLFCLSHRHYLAAGLSGGARLRAALAHYQWCDGWPEHGLWAQVAAPEGLVLWQADDAGPEFRLVLVEGRDVTIEGGLSLVLEIDGGPLSVVSFSMVPAQILRLPPRPEAAAAATAPAPLMPFVTRKQNSMNAAARDAFARRFDRVDPASMAFAGFAALALHCGHRQALGIRGSRHPSWQADYAQVFANGYDGFWHSIGGEPAGPFGFLVDLPPRFAPLEAMTATKRARAMKRRAHLSRVEAAVAARLADLAPTPEPSLAPTPEPAPDLPALQSS